MSAFDEAQKDRSRKNVVLPVSLIPISEGEEHSQDASTGDDEAVQIEAALQSQLLYRHNPITPQPELWDREVPATPWSKPSTSSVDQWMTMPELQASSKASSSSPSTISVEQRMTMPELQVSSRASSSSLSTRSVDQWITTPELQVISEASSSYLMLDGFSTDEQPTWIIPVVRDERRLEQSAAQDAGLQGYASLLRNLVKSSGIYAVASIASPFVTLVLAPFLTRSLSRADYGALAVLSTVIALGAGVTQLGLSSAFFRAYNYDYESAKDRSGIFSTVIALLSLSSAPLVMATLLLAPWVAGLLFNSSSFSDPIRFAALVILLQNLTVPGFAWLRAENRSGYFSVLSIINLLATLSTTLVFVGMLHMGITGAILAVGAGYACVVICTLPVIVQRARVHPRFDIARNLLSFGVPLVFNFVSYWVLQLSDRYLLSRFGSLPQTASYAVAYSLGSVLSVVVLSPFLLAWPSSMFTIAKRKDAAMVFRSVFRWLSIVLLFAAFAFSLVSTAFLDIFFPSAYHSAAEVIPVIALSIIFYGVYNIFSIGVGIQRKTWFTALSTASAALVNVALNIVLIPLHGAIGAATSTLIAYAFLALISYVINQRLYPIPFEIGKFTLAVSIGIALYVGSTVLAQSQETYVAWAISFASLLLYGGCLLLLARLPFWNRKPISLEA